MAITIRKIFLIMVLVAVSSSGKAQLLMSGNPTPIPETCVVKILKRMDKIIDPYNPGEISTIKQAICNANENVAECVLRETFTERPSYSNILEIWKQLNAITIDYEAQQIKCDIDVTAIADKIWPFKNEEFETETSILSKPTATPTSPEQDDKSNREPAFVAVIGALGVLLTVAIIYVIFLVKKRLKSEVAPAHRKDSKKQSDYSDGSYITPEDHYESIISYESDDPENGTYIHPLDVELGPDDEEEIPGRYETIDGLGDVKEKEIETTSSSKPETDGAACQTSKDE